MRYNNTYDAMLVIRRMIVSLPRNGLCQRTSRPFNQPEEESEDNATDDPEDRRSKPDSQPMSGSKLIHGLTD
jgi:hypothetical protein